MSLRPRLPGAPSSPAAPERGPRGLARPLPSRVSRCPAGHPPPRGVRIPPSPLSFSLSASSGCWFNCLRLGVTVLGAASRAGDRRLCAESQLPGLPVARAPPSFLSVLPSAGPRAAGVGAGPGSRFLPTASPLAALGDTGGGGARLWGWWPNSGSHMLCVSCQAPQDLRPARGGVRLPLPVFRMPWNLFLASRASPPERLYQLCCCRKTIKTSSLAWQQSSLQQS